MPNKRGGEGGVKINEGLKIFIKFNNRGGRGGGRGRCRVGIAKYPLISAMNEKKRHKCLILMLNLKVSTQTRSEASKNKVIIKRVSKISIN